MDDGDISGYFKENLENLGNLATASSLTPEDLSFLTETLSDLVLGTCKHKFLKCQVASEDE